MSDNVLGSLFGLLLCLVVVSCGDTVRTLWWFREGTVAWKNHDLVTWREMVSFYSVHVYVFLCTAWLFMILLTSHMTYICTMHFCCLWLSMNGLWSLQGVWPCTSPRNSTHSKSFSKSFPGHSYILLYPFILPIALCQCRGNQRTSRPLVMSFWITWSQLKAWISG